MSNWYMAKEQELRGYLRQLDAGERMAADLENQIRTLDMATMPGVVQAMHERELVKVSTRALTDAAALKKWAEFVAKDAMSGTRSHNAQVAGAGHLVGLGASVKGRANSLAGKIDKIGRKLKECHGKTMDNLVGDGAVKRHGAGATVAFDYLPAFILKTVKVLELVEAIAHWAHGKLGHGHGQH